MKKLLAGLGVLVVLALALPPVFGFIAEDRIKAGIANSLQVPGYSIDLTEYERGLFASHGAVRVGLNEDNLAAITAVFAGEDGVVDSDSDAAMLLARLGEGLLFVVDIEHGPVILQNGPYAGISRVTAQLDPGSDLVAGIATDLGIPYLLELRARMGYTGATEFTGDVPPFTYALAEGNLAFSGLVMQGRYEPVAQTYTYQAAIDSFATTGSKVDISMSALTASGDMQVLPGNLSMGKADFTLGEVRLSAAGQSAIVAQKMRVDTDMSLNDTADAFDIAVVYSVGSLDGMQDTSLRDMRIGLRLENLNRAAVERYMDILQDSLATDPAAIAATRQAMADVGYQVLAGSPALRLDPLAFVVDDQPFAATINLSLDGADLPPLDALTTADPAALLSRITGEGSLEVAETLARSLAQTFVMQQVADSLPPDTDITPAQLLTVVQAQSNLLIDGLVRQRLVVLADGALSSQFSLVDGTLLLNGQPFPLGLPPR